MARKKARKVRVDFKRNRAQPARDNSWTRQYREHRFEDKDTVTRQTQIPKGELTRKRTIIEGADLTDKNLREGVVVAMRGLIAEVDDGQRVSPCTVRRVLRTRLIKERHPVAVGDRVQFMIADDETGVDREGVIYSVHTRTTQLIRRYSDRVHVIVANVDQVLIVASADSPNLKPHLIDRYLVAAHAGNIRPVICINKIDLGDAEESRGVAEMYLRLGYRTILASARCGTGIDELRECLRDQASVIVGQSGVGKSSILNVLQPGLELDTREVSESTAKGRHTTTTSCLLKLDFGGYVVDTPGIRSYDLAVIPKNEYELHFIEFIDHVPNCKFPDCTHIHETNCAVLAAVEAGLIDPRRYESYRRLFEED